MGPSVFIVTRKKKTVLLAKPRFCGRLFYFFMCDLINASLEGKGQANFQLRLALLVPLGDLRVLFTRRVNRDAMSTSLT